jgi:hypothetical protein
MIFYEFFDEMCENNALFLQFLYQRYWKVVHNGQWANHIFCFIMVSCYKKIDAYYSEIRFDPNIPDLEDLAISHAIVSVNKLFKLYIYEHFI